MTKTPQRLSPAYGASYSTLAGLLDLNDEHSEFARVVETMSVSGGRAVVRTPFLSYLNHQLAFGHALYRIAVQPTATVTVVSETEQQAVGFDSALHQCCVDAARKGSFDHEVYKDPFADGELQTAAGGRVLSRVFGEVRPGDESDLIIIDRALNPYGPPSRDDGLTRGRYLAHLATLVSPRAAVMFIQPWFQGRDLGDELVADGYELIDLRKPKAAPSAQP